MNDLLSSSLQEAAEPPAAPEGRWRVVPLDVHPLSPTRVSLHAIDRDRVSLADAPVAQALGACRELRTFAEHEAM
ncbi:MAG: hypothetical protein KC731_38820, partial [Myxococcales bacterium]|nr:hypothetical protein [Myxococcales bacterium]